MGARFLVTESNGDAASKKAILISNFCKSEDSVFRIDLSLEFQFFTDSTKFLANEYLANLLFKGG